MPSGRAAVNTERIVFHPDVLKSPGTWARCVNVWCVYSVYSRTPYPAPFPLRGSGGGYLYPRPYTTKRGCRGSKKGDTPLLPIPAWEGISPLDYTHYTPRPCR